MTLPLRTPGGLTVAELKKLVSDMPETDPDTGEPYEVWIMTDQFTSNVTVLTERLNKGDIVFTPAGV